MPWSSLVLSTLLLVLVSCGNVEYDEAAEVVSDGIDVFSRNLYQVSTWEALGRSD